MCSIGEGKARVRKVSARAYLKVPAMHLPGETEGSPGKLQKGWSAVWFQPTYLPFTVRVREVTAWATRAGSNNLPISSICLWVGAIPKDWIKIKRLFEVP